jgi:uncharacterized protein YwgA
MSKVSSYLRALDIDPQMNNFSQRKRLQKLGFLLQEWGLDLPYRFTWYIHGPYSPGLTQMLYEISQTKDTEAEGLTPDELTRLKKFKNFLGDDILDSDKLELLASVHYLREKANETGASKDDVLLVLKEKKPYFSKDDIDYAWRKSIELDELIQH